MGLLGQTSAVWVLAIILGLMGASCTAHKSAVLVKNMEPLHEQQAETAISREPDAATQAKVQAAFGKLPLYFIENRGQIDEQVAYYIQGHNTTLYFTSQGLTFALSRTAARRPPHPGPPSALLRTGFDSAQGRPLPQGERETV